MSSENRPLVILIPGNGCTNISKANWYASVAKEIESLGYSVKLENYPDPYEAKESVWIPFIHDELANGREDIILIGHSSGSEAAMRYMEKYKVVGTILVSACWTDLGEPSEAISGYYNHPWLWSTIKSNAQWIIQFGSEDDPFIPISEMRHVATEIGTEYLEYKTHGHFMTRHFPELIEQFKRVQGL